MPIQGITLPVINDNIDLNDISIGNSRFTDDIWDLSTYINLPNVRSYDKKAIFSYVKSENVKHTIKLFAYYRLGVVKPMSVCKALNSRIRNIIKFFELNNIESFSEITCDIFMDFCRWLKDDYRNITTNKKISNNTGYLITNELEQIIRLGQIQGWDVPQHKLLNVSSFTLWHGSKKKQRENAKLHQHKPIPGDVLTRILDCVINKEKNIHTKAGIIAQSQTGLRISEILSLKKGCIQYQDGNAYLIVAIRKTEKGEPVLHKIFVNELVRNAISELVEKTENLRNEYKEKLLITLKGIKTDQLLTTFEKKELIAKLKQDDISDYLFLTKSTTLRNQIVVAKGTNWNPTKLVPFIKKWDIRGKGGELYHLTSHDFRPTFVREVIKKGINIGFVQKQFDHVSLAMTCHYLQLEAEEIKQIYADIILNADSKIAGIRAKEIKATLNTLFEGKTVTQIEEITQDLVSTMQFNTLPNGVCLYDVRRGNCTDGDGCFMYNCPNYLTEVEFLPVHKKELDMLELERLLLIERYN